METIYTELKTRWCAGERDRELGLHLLYLSWMHWADPLFVTGMTDDEAAIPLWHEIYESFGGEASSDPEFLYVVAIMAFIAPEELGGEELWAPRVERMNTRAAELKPEGFVPEMFEGRGEYGLYFAHQSRR